MNDCDNLVIVADAVGIGNDKFPYPREDLELVVSLAFPVIVAGVFDYYQRRNHVGPF
jgi:hypothetical protein